MFSQLTALTIPLVIIVCAVLVGYFYLESRKLVFRVALKSRKEFNEFDPHAYLLTIPKDDYQKIKNLLYPDSKKNKLEVRWRYTTPAGKSTYNGSKTYKLPAVEGYVQRLDPVFQNGEAKIQGLNALYMSELRVGNEINDALPKIYCYSIPDSADHINMVKVGYAKGNAHKRIQNQFKTAAHLKIDYQIRFIQPAISITDEPFMDHKVHKILKANGVKNPKGEWFYCNAETALKAVHAAQLNQSKL